MRLLPWTGVDGRPCYLSTDDPDSLLSRLADDIEAAQLASAEQVLAGARAVLGDTGAGERALRFALVRAVESLGEVLRVAASLDERVARPRCPGPESSGPSSVTSPSGTSGPPRAW